MDAAEVRDLISSLEQDVGRCLEDGKKQYKVLMDSLLESKQPFKDSQLLHFHQRNVEIIKQAFDKSYEEIIQFPQANISRKIKQLVSNAKQQLDTHAGQQFRDIYVRKHEIQIDAIVKKVKGITNQAEMLYDEAADNIQPQDSNDRDVKKAHKKCAKKARQLFTKLQKSNGLDQEFFKCELNHRLKERLGDFLSELPESDELVEDPTSRTLTPEPLSEAEITQMLEPVKQDLLQCINEGLASYTAFMESLLEPNQPLTDSQIFQYHSNISEAINNAVDASYTDINGINNVEISSKMWHLVSQAKTGLNTLLLKHYHTVVLRKHEIQIDGIVKKVKGFTTQAEMLYDEKAEQPLPPGIPKNEILIAHERWEADAVKLFDDCLAESNVESQDFWKFELKQRLKEREEYLIEEYDLPAPPPDLPAPPPDLPAPPPDLPAPPPDLPAPPPDLPAPPPDLPAPPPDLPAPPPDLPAPPPDLPAPPPDLPAPPPDLPAPPPDLPAPPPDLPAPPPDLPAPPPDLPAPPPDLPAPPPDLPAPPPDLPAPPPDLPAPPPDLPAPPPDLPAPPPDLPAPPPDLPAPPPDLPAPPFDQRIITVDEPVVPNSPSDEDNTGVGTEVTPVNNYQTNTKANDIIKENSNSVKSTGIPCTTTASAFASIRNKSLPNGPDSDPAPSQEEKPTDANASPENDTATSTGSNVPPKDPVCPFGQPKTQPDNTDVPWRNVLDHLSEGTAISANDFLSTDNSSASSEDPPQPIVDIDPPLPDPFKQNGGRTKATDDPHAIPTLNKSLSNGSNKSVLKDPNSFIATKPVVPNSPTDKDDPGGVPEFIPVNNSENKPKANNNIIEDTLNSVNSIGIPNGATASKIASKSSKTLSNGSTGVPLPSPHEIPRNGSSSTETNTSSSNESSFPQEEIACPSGQRKTQTDRTKGSGQGVAVPLFDGTTISASHPLPTNANAGKTTINPTISTKVDPEINGNVPMPPNNIAAHGPTGVVKKQSGPPQPPMTSQFDDIHARKEEDKKMKIKKPLRLIIPQPSKSPVVQLPVRQEIDLGIYFGDNSFEVGIYHPNPKPNYQAVFEKIVSITPEICFLNHQPYVVLGHEAHPYGNKSRSNNSNCRYFDLCTLITAPNEIVHNSFSIKNTSYTLCTHHIMAIFIKLVVCSLEDKFGKKIGKAIFTIPFTPTSATKERLQRSAEIAGLKKSNIRILSTLSTMAIAALKTESENNHTGFLGAQGSQLLTNHVVVLDVQRNYFSVGVVELSPAKVTVKSAYGSANLVPPSDKTFSELHSSLYIGLPLSFENDKVIRQIYRDAVSYVLSHTEGLTSLVALVVNENISIHIPKLVQKLVQDKFRNFNTISVCSPLEGASLLALSASKYIEKSSYLLLPPSLTGIQIQESSRFDLMLVVGKKGNKRELFSLQGKIFGGTNNKVFSWTCFLNGTSSRIELHEVCGKAKYEASCHLVSIKNSGSFLSQLSGGRLELEIHATQNVNGIFTLSADSPHMPQTDLERKDVSCSCHNINWGHFKEVMKLGKTAMATTAEVLPQPLQLPAQPEIQTVKFNEQSPLHAGILIDQNVFNIGVYSSQSNTCTQILSTVPEICFLPDRILVGQEASPYRYQKGNGWTHFDIFQLLSSRTSKYGSPFQIATRQQTIGCIHEVIGAFLRHVLQSLVKLTENGVGRIIFTAPFTLTSVVKERLQKGAIYAGLKDFRILSTLLTSAASTLHMEPITKHVFVTDIHPTYFSVAIVSMSGASIVAKNQCGSENINEYFQSPNFLEWHQSLCEGIELTNPCRNHISHIYEKAIDQVLINTQGLPSVYRIFTSNHFPLIEAIVADILRRKLGGDHISSRPTVGCPLIGASLLASQSNGRIKARDSSRYNIDLTFLKRHHGEAKFHSHEFQHVNGNQFSAASSGCLFRQKKIPLSFNRDGTSVLFVTLDEIYCHKHSILEVCRYKIILSRGNRSCMKKIRAWFLAEELSLRPVCLVNDDGVLSLHLNCSPEFPTSINVERVYNSGECNSVCDKYFRNLDPLQTVSVNEEIAGSSRSPLLKMQTGEFNV